MTSTLIKALPQDPGISGWEATLPRWQPAAPLDEQKTADFLVIGAGFAGIAAAKGSVTKPLMPRSLFLKLAKLRSVHRGAIVAS